MLVYGVGFSVWNIWYGERSNDQERVAIPLALFSSCMTLELAQGAYFSADTTAHGVNMLLHYRTILINRMPQNCKQIINRFVLHKLFAWQSILKGALDKKTLANVPVYFAARYFAKVIEKHYLKPSTIVLEARLLFSCGMVISRSMFFLEISLSQIIQAYTYISILAIFGMKKTIKKYTAVPELAAN